MTRETFALEIQLLDRQGNPFGPICEVHALMANDRGDSTGRCSGTFIIGLPRDHTYSSPHGFGVRGHLKGPPRYRVPTTPDPA